MKPTRLLASLFLVLFSFTLSTTAQELKMKFGDVSLADLQMTSFDADTNAQAVILGELGKVTVDVRGNIKYDYHIRVKLLSEAAYEDWGTVAIPYWNGEYSASERLSKVQGNTFVLDQSGKAVRHKLGKKEIFKEKVSDKWMQLRFTLPALEPGAVVEYRYSMTTENPVFLPDWDFQHSEPTIWSEYRATISQNFGYVQVHNVPYFSIEDEQQITGPEGDSNEYRWVIKDMPALREEPYITTLEDYKAKIEFQLSKYVFPGSPVQSYLSTWDQLAKELREDPEFGGAMKGTKKIRNQAEALTAGVEDPHEKLKLIHDYVRSNITWDGKYRYYASGRLDKVVSAGAGSNGDQIMILIAMLRSVGLEAYPVLLSTRRHGAITRLYPLLSQFNYMVAKVNVRGKEYLVDCTDPMAPVDLLPLRALNRVGWLVGDAGAQWVPLNATSKYMSMIQLDGEMDEYGRLTGKVTASSGGYNALEVRTAIAEEGESEIVNTAILDEMESMQVNLIEIQNKDDYEKGVTVVADLTVEEFAQQAGDFLYVNPHALSRWDENPLRLEKRTFPVDIGYPLDYIYMVQINLPQGYTIQDTIADTRMVIPGKGGLFQRSTTVENGVLKMQTRFTLNKERYDPGTYKDLRELFDRVVAAEAEQIVLKRTE